MFIIASGKYRITEGKRRKPLKRQVTLLAIIALVLFTVTLSVMSPGVESAEKPRGSQYSSTYKFTQTVDSTVAIQYDTFSTVGHFTEIVDYASLEGYYVLNYVAVDTGTGGVYVDTTKDTVVVQIYTKGQSGTPSKLIYTDTIVAIHATAVAADYVYFDVSDSTSLDYVEWRVISILQDSVYTKARLAAGIDYQLTYKFYAK